MEKILINIEVPKEVLRKTIKEILNEKDEEPDWDPPSLCEIELYNYPGAIRAQLKKHTENAPRHNESWNKAEERNLLREIYCAFYPIAIRHRRTFGAIVSRVNNLYKVGGV